MRCKICVIGGGKLPSAIVEALARRDYADLLLVDTDRKAAQTVTLDLGLAELLTAPAPPGNGGSEYESISGSDIVVVAERSPDDGEGRRPRDTVNAVSAIAREVAERSPNAVVVVATAPVTAMCHTVSAVTHFPRRRIVGPACAIGTARMRALIARELNVSIGDVDALVLGDDSHSSAAIVSCTSVAGIPVTQLLARPRLTELARGADRELPAFPAEVKRQALVAGVLELCDAVVTDRTRVLTSAALCQGELGFDNLFVGVPVKLAGDGIAAIVEPGSDDAERELLARTAAALRELAGDLASG